MTQPDSETTTSTVMTKNSVVHVEASLGWNPSADEHRRAFIIENCAPYEWSIKDMQDLFQWLKGEVNEQPKLRSVK